MATLESDRDRDGLTDIVEERLLLNPSNADSDGDGLEDGRDPLPNVKNSEPPRDTTFLTQVLQHIFQLREGALVEPVDRNPAFLFQGTPGKEPGGMRPLLINGSPSDFAAVRLSSPVLVYTDTEVARIRERSADFNALSLDPVIFNRARDRGYIRWSRGWTGGNLRLIRERNGWRIEEISMWVS